MFIYNSNYIIAYKYKRKRRIIMKILLLDTETTGIDREKNNVLEFGAVLYDPKEVHSFEDLDNAPKITIMITRPAINGSFYAMNMNSKILNETLELCKEYNVSNEYKEFGVQIQTSYEEEFNHTLFLCTPDTVVLTLLQWMAANDGLTYTNYAMKIHNDYNGAKQAIMNLTADTLHNVKYLLKATYMGGKNIITFDLPILNSDIPNFDLVKYKYRQVDPSIVYTTYVDKDIPDLAGCFSKLNVEQSTQHRAVYDALDVAILLFFHFKNNNIKTALVVSSKDFGIIESHVFKSQSELDQIKKSAIKDHKNSIVLTEPELNLLAIKARIHTFDITYNDRYFNDDNNEAEKSEEPEELIGAVNTEKGK